MSIPIETVFMSNSDKARRDPLIKNRIYYTYPESWCNAIKSNPTIGIRDLFIAKSFKHPVIKISYHLYKQTTVTASASSTIINPPISIKNGDVLIDKYFDDEILLKEFVSSINEKLDNVKFNDIFTESNNFIDLQLETINQTKFLESHYEFFINSNDEHCNRLVIESPFNALPSATRTAHVDVSNSYNEYWLTFDVSEMNDDAQKLLTDKEGCEDRSPIYFNDIWDRNSCIIYSNISEQTDSGYLGHTRKQTIQNIKYYKINSNSRSFWIDLFATCDHKAPVVLPPDDEMIIEAQLLI